MPLARRTPSHYLGQILTRTLIAFLCIAALVKPVASAVPSVAYTVAITKPAAATLSVTMTFTPTTADSIDVCIPKWSPGWYVLLNTPDNITGVTAAQDSAPLNLSHPTAAQWTLTPVPGKPVTVHYTVKTETKGLGFFHAAISENHAFIPGTTTLMYIKGEEQKPCSVLYKVPMGWHVASPNHAVPGVRNMFDAPSYDHLADHPADLGAVELAEDTIDGNTLAVTVVGAPAGTAQRWLNALTRIWNAATRAFGEAPANRYTFQLRFSDYDGFYGGLEHLDSAVIRLPRASASKTSMSDLRLCAHELIHAWMVKRIRPQGLGPFDYSTAVQTPDLWFCEGVTDYLAPKLCVSAGIMTRADYLADLSEQLTELGNNPASRSVTAEQCSLRVWEASNSQGYGGLSYYNKGYVVGLMMDLEIGNRTAGKKSLWDVIWRMLDDYRSSGKAYPVRGVDSVAEMVGGQGMRQLMDSLLRSTDPIDPMPLLQVLGVAASGRKQDVPYLGLVLDTNHTPGDKAFVSFVQKGSPAEIAGIRPGMTLLGAAASGMAIANATIGTTLTLRCETEDGKAASFAVTMAPFTFSSIKLTVRPDATAEQKERLNALAGVGLRRATAAAR
jgi:predicted metalloprotease with PDZ domain